MASPGGTSPIVAEARTRKLPFTAGKVGTKRRKRKEVLAPASESLKRTPLDDYLSPPRKMILPMDSAIDLEEIRCQCESEAIPEKFITLVQFCKQESQSDASEADVLRALLAAAGDVKRTLAAFTQK